MRKQRSLKLVLKNSSIATSSVVDLSDNQRLFGNVIEKMTVEDAKNHILTYSKDKDAMSKLINVNKSIETDALFRENPELLAIYTSHRKYLKIADADILNEMEDMNANDSSDNTFYMRGVLSIIDYEDLFGEKVSPLFLDLLPLHKKRGITVNYNHTSFTIGRMASIYPAKLTEKIIDHYNLDEYAMTEEFKNKTEATEEELKHKRRGELVGKIAIFVECLLQKKFPADLMLFEGMQRGEINGLSLGAYACEYSYGKEKFFIPYVHEITLTEAPAVFQARIETVGLQRSFEITEKDSNSSIPYKSKKQNNSVETTMTDSNTPNEGGNGSPDGAGSSPDIKQDETINKSTSELLLKTLIGIQTQITKSEEDNNKRLSAMEKALADLQTGTEETKNKNIGDDKDSEMEEEEEKEKKEKSASKQKEKSTNKDSNKFVAIDRSFITSISSSSSAVSAVGKNRAKNTLMLNNNFLQGFTKFTKSNGLERDMDDAFNKYIMTEEGMRNAEMAGGTINI